VKRVVVIGGGTGSYAVLRGLKRFPVRLSAVVTMSDSGGSTGILRDELGVLPPGDVRQCLVALSNSSELMRNLMSYRFEQGGLAGHSFGNLFLSALEKVTGSFTRAVEEMEKILAIQGKVVPITTNQIQLQMELADGTLLKGEEAIYLSNKILGYRDIRLLPHSKAYDGAIEEIMCADVVVFGPGGLYTSLIPNLLVDGITQVLHQCRATKIFVINLMNRRGQTDGFRASDHLKEIQKFAIGDPFNYIICNCGTPPQELIAAYAQEGELVVNDLQNDPRVISADLLSNSMKSSQKGDILKRNLIRHDPAKLAKELMKIVAHT
jgi:uncharacterized cofD-like protein